MIVFDMLETRDGTWVPILSRQMVRTSDGRIGMHMTLDFDHDAIEWRDGSGLVWVKRKESNRGSPHLEIEEINEEE